mgnify:CR=1 FL=1
MLLLLVKKIDMEEINWYCKKIGKKFDEFDEFDKYITDVLKDFVKEQKEKKKLPVKGVSKSVNCGHPMENRADVNNSIETYCLKCSTFI